MAKNKKRIEFDLPSGLILPDQLSESREFEALATIQLKEDGKACLVAIDGNRMPGYTDGEGQDDESKPDKDIGYAEAASAGMEGY
jgi:hypothetical protein